VIPTAFDYHRATSVDDAIRKLRDTGGKLVAGGHSLVPLMKLRLSEPTALIDIARIPDLSGIRGQEGQIEIGAATVHHDIASSSVLRQNCPMVSDAAGAIGDPQVRNRGTLGGSLAHADPSADYPAVMLALDAGINILGPGGSRVVKANDFFQDLFTVDLAPDEVITSVRFRPIRAAAYAKLHQRASHYAIVGVAVALEVQGGTIQSARVGLTGASRCATRLASVEQALTGQPLSAQTIEAAARNAGDDVGEINADIHASESYRRAMIAVFARRAMQEAAARA
jgi:carbon-monoxide dehydrogenase medium subunit